MIRPGIQVSLSLSILAFLFLVAAPPGAQAGHVNFFLGSKVLDEKDWAPWDTHTEAGVEASWGGEDWPVLIATDLFGSTKSKDVLGVDTQATTGELGLGVRKIWNTGSAKRVHPYIGGGVSFISAKLEATSGGNKVSDHDNGVGAWLGGGIFWRLGSRFNLGMSLRGSSANVDLYGVSVDAGGGHFGLSLGWGWPAAAR